MLFFIDTISPIPKFVFSDDNIITFEKIPTNNDTQVSDSIVKKILEIYQNDLKKINTIGVCTGPGSFTSLRMGIALGIGFKSSLNIPLFGINAFEILLHYSTLNYSYNNINVFIQSSNNQNFYAQFNKNKDIILQPKKIDDLSNIKTEFNNSIIISNYKMNQNDIHNHFSFNTSKDIGKIINSKNYNEFNINTKNIHPLYL